MTATTSGTIPAHLKSNRVLIKWSLLAAALVLGYFMWQCGAGHDCWGAPFR
jgi:hypothetical protein